MLGLPLNPLHFIHMNSRVWFDEAYLRPIEIIASNFPSVASADLGCVISRLKMKQAPVRLPVTNML